MSFSEITREPIHQPNTLIQLNAVKRWWRQRARLFENLSVLSGKRLEQANAMILRREGQLRDAVFIISWMRTKFLDKQAILAHRQPDDPQTNGFDESTIEQMDCYEDEIRKMMRDLEREAKINPVEDDYDFGSAEEEAEWRQKNFAGFCLLKHWKRRALASERQLLTVVQQREMDRKRIEKLEAQLSEAVQTNKYESTEDVKAPAKTSEMERDPEYVHHASFIVDMLNQTTSLLRQYSDTPKQLEYLDKDPIPAPINQVGDPEDEVVGVKEAPVSSKKNQIRPFGQKAKSPLSKDSIDAQIRKWRQRFIERDIEAREKNRELQECQHQLATLYLEMDDLRKSK